ncbi:hypothetical protein N9597_00455 [Candidatus Marinimicrobia bacterium]|jgi:hypothetical protein|nr:hypothetical protein [Candidatus Neomarinimicrobiota bacterium]|tara:strand:+ start:678 stop:836 length:159 start_codon:yes stop_codon:yes gene_type:complete
MESTFIGLIMAMTFLAIFISRIFYLQKEVRKLNNITSYLIKEIKSLKGKNGK